MAELAIIGKLLFIAGVLLVILFCSAVYMLGKEDM